MALVRYEPWTVMSQLQEEIQRAFSNATDTGHGSNSSNATADWTPAVLLRNTSNNSSCSSTCPASMQTQSRLASTMTY